MRIDGRRTVTLAIRDVTERTKRERALRRVYEIVADGDRSLDEQIEDLLAVGRAVVGTDYGTFSHVRGDRYEFESVDVADDIDLEAGTTAQLVELPICERVVETGDAHVLGDVRAEAPELVDPTWGIACYLGAPVVVEGDTYGTFCFYDVEARSEEFSDWVTTFVELLADWVGTELARHRTGELLAHRNERLDEVASVVGHDLKGPLNVAEGHLEMARETSGSDHLDEVDDALDRMETMIDDLLARVREGDRVGNFEVVDAAPVVEQCWRTVRTDDATVEVDVDRPLRADPVGSASSSRSSSETPSTTGRRALAHTLARTPSIAGTSR